MRTRLVCASLCFAAALSAQISFSPFPRSLKNPPPLSEAEAAQAESQLGANPEDLADRLRLLRYYGAPEVPERDSAWSNRWRLLEWMIQNHPESPFLMPTSVWANMPDPLFSQAKQIWTAQVQQHSDSPQVLRNAAAFLDSRNAPHSIRVGANVQQANLMQKVDPEYPALAKQARISGIVRFNVTIGEDGHIQNMELVSGHPLLVASAQQAVQQWVYKPTLLNGQPVAVSTTIDVNFTLQP